jgi:hypothetical protein
MSILETINTLATSRPTADAPATAVAAWYERKAVMLHQVAKTSATVSEHDTYETLASRAHQHAIRLVASGGGR